MSTLGPYLHDGRAATLYEAIGFHGGEAQDARAREMGHRAVADLLVELSTGLDGEVSDPPTP